MSGGIAGQSLWIHPELVSYKMDFLIPQTPRSSSFARAITEKTNGQTPLLNVLNF